MDTSAHTPGARAVNLKEFDAIFFCPPGIDRDKYEGMAQREVARGLKVSFHLHRHSEDCVVGCWYKRPQTVVPD